MSSDDREFMILFFFILAVACLGFVVAYVDTTDTTREVCEAKCYPNTYYDRQSSATRCICDLTRTVK
jgi:hypothetical protein